ncbi:hypothetical protein ACSBR2_010884 [Camellia fascicularis]
MVNQIEWVYPSDGGWQPVVRRHGGRGVRNSWTNGSIHSIFVDNLPETMRAKGLFSIFCNYRVVVDTFIPNKRRKMTSSRFGFVRYSCPVAADMAIQKANGLWCDDKALKVKKADYSKEYGTKQQAGPSMQPRKFAEKLNSSHVGYQRKRSFAEVVSGKASGSNSSCIIKAYEEGNGWLYESVIARLKPIYAVEEFKAEIVRRDLGEVQGMSITQERKVWLSCYGVPLNLWSCNTFINIGKMWGVVTALDEDTRNLNHFQCGKVQIATNFMDPINQSLSLECKGVIYLVRVCEEQIIIIQDMKMAGLSHSSEEHFGGTRNSILAKVGNQIADKGSKHEEGVDHVIVQAHDSSNTMVEDDQLRDTSMVAESDLQKGMSEEIGYVRQESSARLLRAVDDGRSEVEFQSSGLIRTLSGPDNLIRGINLIVDLPSAHECYGLDEAPVLDHLAAGPNSLAPPTAGLVPFDIGTQSLHSAPIIHGVGASNHLQPKHSWRLNATSSPPNSSSFQKIAPRRKLRRMKGLRTGTSSFGLATLNLRKGAVFRSAVAAISLSMASKSSRGRLALSEPEATLALGKTLGIDFEEKDEEVISKLQQLEAEDMEKVRARVGDAN